MKSIISIRILLLALLSTFMIACSEQNPYMQNEHYTTFENTIDDVIKQQPDIAQTQVLEFFTYGCSHCQTFAPVLSSWAKAKSITVGYIPVVWNDVTELYAKAFYLIKGHSNFVQLHAGLFELIAGFSRTDSLEEQKIALIDWFQQQGIQPIETLEALNSSRFEQELARSVLLTQRFKITGTPTLVVNHAHRINNKAVKSQQQLLDIAESLVRE